MVLVLDGYTANFPWELMLADEKPLALSVAMVRQLQSPRFRSRIRQTLDKRAYVIGNPSTKGFNKVFADGTVQAAPEALPSLEGAENEAQTVLNVLRQEGYDCEEAVGGEIALDIINKLYRSLYRIVHIAAHGVFEQKARDGGCRSGVVLSDGLLITAAEIGAMETVPDLVFLNCCHLAKADARPVAFNRLAYSIARELIEMGVRAVVAAGWAVDDGAARLFAEEFYTHILSNRPFGEAVFAARENTYAKFPASNTWGAYQAYGDPSFVLDPQRTRSAPQPVVNWTPVTHEELVLKLRELRREAATVTTPTQSRELAGSVDRLLRSCPEEWKSLPIVGFGLGEVYGELGDAYFEVARHHYLEAICCEDGSRDDTLGGVPIRAIEHLADLEARVGELRGDEPLIETAVNRLQSLVQAGTGSRGVGPQRAALLGRACTRLAALRARNLLADPKGKDGSTLLVALDQAIAGYGKGGEQPSQVLNLLALETVRDLGARSRSGAIERCRACVREARAHDDENPDFWSDVIQAQALMTERLLDRSLGAEGPPGEAAFQEVRKAYADALAHERGTPREREAVVRELRNLQVLFEVRGRLEARLEPRARLISTRLGLVADPTQGPTAGPRVSATRARKRPSPATATTKSSD
jgi:hypothetical protein